VIIVSHADDSCHVSVWAFRSERIWVKSFKYKRFCLAELIFTGLLTHDEKADAQASNFGNRDRTFVVHATIDPLMLRAAGFAEQKTEYVH
jgi:hypothetical protein